MKTWLIVVDMQHDFVYGALGTQEAQAIVPAVNAKIRAAQRVIFTLDTHEKDYLQTREGAMLPVAHCIKGTQGHALISDMPQPAGSEQIEKPSFGSVELAQRVKDLFAAGELDAVELIGVCTDICVVSNALLIKAFCPELPISVDASCCAGVTPQKHEAALETMRSCQIQVN
ncbi:MAG: cysteine hydrolase [Oscillospiraceae bacterium]|jgi:nicotinamidase-related amidase|nr:cysteine hydrolase [Oscillospiraceae bacterium]